MGSECGSQMALAYRLSANERRYAVACARQAAYFLVSLIELETKAIFLADSRP